MLSQRTVALSSSRCSSGLVCTYSNEAGLSSKGSRSSRPVTRTAVLQVKAITGKSRAANRGARHLARPLLTPRSSPRLVSIRAVEPSVTFYILKQMCLVSWRRN